MRPSIMVLMTNRAAKSSVFEAKCWHKSKVSILDSQSHRKIPEIILLEEMNFHAFFSSTRKEEGMSSDPTFNVSVIFGKRDEQMLEACARQLIEHMSSSGSSKPLVLSLGLKDHSTETLKAIVSAVIDNRLW